MQGFQFISCLRFSVQLLVAEGMFLLLFPRREPFPLRAAGAAAAYLAGLRLLYEAVSRIPGRHVAVYTVYYVAVFALTLLAMRFCFGMTGREILFAGVGGYALQHMAYAATQLMLYFWPLDAGTLADYFLRYFFFYLLLPPVFYIVFIRKQFDREGLQNRDRRLIGIAVLVLAVNITLNQLLRLEPAAASSAFLRQCICSVYILLCCGMELFLLFYIPRESRLRTESELMEKMIHTMDARLRLSRKSIGIINKRCHEIKCQLHELKAQNERLAQSAPVQEIEQAIAVYDSAYQTGNFVLDFVLNERSPLMEEEKIRFSCIADGAQLAFMRQTDISTLFGNALDNALECVLQEADAEKRIVDLRISRQGEMLHIHLSNYCALPVRFRDGFPVGEENSPALHGFGVRSVAHVMEKYDGIVSFRQQNDRFILDAACPIPQNHSA